MRYWWIGALVAVLAAGGAFWAHRRAVAAAAPAAAYETEAAKRGDLVSTMTATGTVEAWNETVVRVGVGVSGTLEPFTWNVSQQVQRGQVLFNLVNPQQVQQTQSDEASLQEAELQLQQMQAAAADSAPQQAALHNAQLQVQQAQYAYGQAQADLQAEQQVVAPVSGTVSAVDGVAGQSVTAGATLASIVQTTGLLAQVDVPQAQLAGIAPGQPALVFVNGGNYPGQVQSVGPAPDVTYRGVPSYPVTVALTNPGSLLPGMPVTVSVETATAPQAWTTGLAGTLAPLAAVGVVAQAPGTLVTVAVRVGQDVQAGQVLAQIQSSSLQNAVTADLQNLRQSEGALAALQANQAAAASATPYNVQQQELKVQTLRDSVTRDQSLEAGLIVRSPVSGVISGIEAVAGEPVGPGTPLLTIGDYSRLLVTFPLDQLFVNQVKVGQPAAVTATAAPGKTFSGSLYLVSPEGNDVNGIATFQAEVEIPRPTPQLRPGMAVGVRIVLGKATGVLTVPLQALHAGKGSKDFVVVVTPESGASPSTQEVPVRVGMQNQLDAQVTGALHAGEEVLTGSIGALPSAKSLNVRGRVLQHRAQVTHRAPANARK
jgi:RND family efflux transporter MFP subunit